LASISDAARLEDFKDAELIIEAASENLSLKQELFVRLDAIVSSDAILATNTSSLSVQAIMSKIKTPSRTLGMHFFNPAPVMELVEMVRLPRSEEKYFKSAWDFALRLGKTPVQVKDTPGFIVNRIVRLLYLDAMRMVAQGLGGFRDIDNAVKAQGLPMGPFEIMDFIGLDVNLTITKVIYESLDRPQRLRPHPIQEKLVKAGYWGKKTGKGFYIYDEGERLVKENPEALALLPAEKTPALPENVWKRIMNAVADEAEKVFKDGVASRQDIDTAVELAMHFPQGPLKWRDNASKA
jgi:3-hydroxybutyryl-CoA dehydrogenase